MVKYTRLWETMQRKGISQYRLIKTYGISNGQLNRLRKIYIFRRIPWRLYAEFWTAAWRM